MIDENELAKSAPKVPDNSSKPTKREKVVNTIGEKTVWVKCVSPDKPWTGERPLEFWKDYRIDTEDALIMDQRHQVVILKEPKGE